MEIKELKNTIELCVKANLTPFIQGSPGIGKSAIVKDVANAMNLELIDVRLSQCDIADLNGLPKLDGKKATFLPFDVFPIEGDELPKGKDGWLLFLDELNSANKAVQAASYKLILDRMVGNHKLHSAVKIVSAGNLITDNAVVNQLSTALRSRLVNLTIDFKSGASNAAAWIDWGFAHGIDPRILAYIQYKPDHLFDFDPEKDGETYACPRTWDMLSKLLSNIQGNKLKAYTELIKGTVGSIAHEFIEYTKYANQLPDFKKIKDGTIQADPNMEIGMKWMVIFHLLDHAKQIKTNSECDNVLGYVIDIGKDYAAAFIQQSRANNISYFQFPAFTKRLNEIVM